MGFVKGGKAKQKATFYLSDNVHGPFFDLFAARAAEGTSESPLLWLDGVKLSNHKRSCEIPGVAVFRLVSRELPQPALASYATNYLDSG